MNNYNFYTVRGYLMKEDSPLTPSMEDYLEMIFRLCERNGFTRIKDLADQLHVRASSCTKIVQKIAGEGYLKYERYGMVQLTELGKKYGAFLLFRHQVVEAFLKKVGVAETLLKDTELIEHHISPQLLNELKSFNDFLELNPTILQSYYTFRNLSK